MTGTALHGRVSVFLHDDSNSAGLYFKRGSKPDLNQIIPHLFATDVWNQAHKLTSSH
jgi:hypothetical protein